jgi:hypothetical protein
MAPVVYTLALTFRAREFCGTLAKHGVSITHFEFEVDLVEAIAKGVPNGVVIHGTKVEARELEARVRALPGAGKVGVITIGKLAPRAWGDDDDIAGTAAAVMTVFDTMPELSDSDPWERRPI